MKENTKMYKVLTKDMSSPIQEMQYEIGKEYVCQDFDDSDEVCSRGFHAVPFEGLIVWFRKDKQHRIFEVKVSGKSVVLDPYKQRYEKIMLIKEVSHDELKVLAKEEEERLGYKSSEAMFPFNPLKVKNTKLSRKDKENLDKWIEVLDLVGGSVRDSVWESVRDSVRDSVWHSVRSSVRESVWDSVGNSVWSSVRESVGESVWDSVGNSVWSSVRESVTAYIGSLFPNINEWKYVANTGKYPFQSAVDLWYRGFIPCKVNNEWVLMQSRFVVQGIHPL